MHLTYSDWDFALYYNISYSQDIDGILNTIFASKGLQIHVEIASTYCCTSKCVLLMETSDHTA